MKRIHCIVEGQTEVRVFYSILAPYILEKTGCHIVFTPIKHSDGGIVKYSKLLPEFRNHLLDSQKIVTTFFDYYGILEKHNFPLYKEAKVDQSNASLGASILERGLIEDLNQKGLNTRNFFPYIQLHEFEAVLFSSHEGFEFQFDNPNIVRELTAISTRYINPEEINDSPVTAPSKRLERIAKANGEKYIKTVDGEAIATVLGIDTILEKCPRFRSWVNILIEKLNEK